MRIEIGSEFWSVPTIEKKNMVFPKNTVWFLSGRTALDYVIQDIKSYSNIKSVALPSYCCESMIAPFVKNGLKVEFYPVYLDNSGILKQDVSQGFGCDVLLTMDYFGYKKQCDSYGYEGIIIRDVTHSIFADSFDTDIQTNANYTIGSLRKWAGFQTGGFAWSKTGIFYIATPEHSDWHYVALRRNAMIEKSDYMAGNRENKGYLNIFSAAEAYLDDGPLGAAIDADIQAAMHLDIDFIIKRRRENARVLLETVYEMAIFPEVHESDCPLFVPISVPDCKRESLRKHLIERQIYCPVHWPVSDLHRLDDKSRKLYDYELSLVCDQRYTTNDMHRICEAVEDFFR